MHLTDAAMKMLFSLPPAAVLFVVSCMEVPAYIRRQHTCISVCIEHSIKIVPSLLFVQVGC